MLEISVDFTAIYVNAESRQKFLTYNSAITRKLNSVRRCSHRLTLLQKNRLTKFCSTMLSSFDIAEISFDKV